MRYLVDSDWVADALKGRTAATTLLTQLAPAGIAISLITYGEIYEGIYYGTNPKAAERVFRQFLRAVPVLPLNRPLMREFARIRGQLRSGGLLIGDDDIMIAATSIYHQLELVTRNIQHFRRVPNLNIY